MFLYNRGEGQTFRQVRHLATATSVVLRPSHVAQADLNLFIPLPPLLKCPLRATTPIFSCLKIKTVYFQTGPPAKLDLEL